MNESIQLRALDLITGEYKKKSYLELKAIEKNRTEFCYQCEGLNFSVEIHTNSTLHNILRIMISVEPDCCAGNLHGCARYYGITADNTIIENNDMSF